MDNFPVYQDEDILLAWLSDLHFEEYFNLFISAGYDMPTISRYLMLGFRQMSNVYICIMYHACKLNIYIFQNDA